MAPAKYAIGKPVIKEATYQTDFKLAVGSACIIAIEPRMIYANPIRIASIRTMRCRQIQPSNVKNVVIYPCRTKDQRVLNIEIPTIKKNNKRIVFITKKIRVNNKYYTDNIHCSVFLSIIKS